MAYDLATVTNSGNQLLASVVSDKSSLVIDKIEVSGTQLASSTDLKSMTSISNVVQTLSANGYQKKDSSFIISTVLDNSSVTADYQAWVFGIWAHETGGGSPILMSVITSTSSPDTITKGAGTPVDYNYKFITTFSNTSSLTIQMSSNTYATNDTVLHNSGDETATGTKTFQEIKISNDKFPSLVQTDGQYITLDGGTAELVPADDSKVVHSKDMRKPASDVAGIEETVLDNHNNTITANGTSYDLSKSGLTPVQLSGVESFNDLPLGTVFGLPPMTDGPDKIHGFITTTFCFNGWDTGRKAQIAIADSVNTMYFRIYAFSTWHSWTSLSDDSKVVHSTDMRKPASDVAGIDEMALPLLTPITGSTNFDANTYTTRGIATIGIVVENLTNFPSGFSGAGLLQVAAYNNSGSGSQFLYDFNKNILLYRSWTTPSSAKVFTSWIQLSDDSKVAHLSGANNFDTVPTVNNNPLLLASSLPVDLARTGSDQEFTGKNTFDTAPIDKITGNPYITKDGVPSTLADTTKLANFTAGLQSGGVSVATSDDLKSVADSAWRELDLSGTSGIYQGKILIKIDKANKYIYFIMNAQVPLKSYTHGTKIIDLSSVVTGLSAAHGYLQGWIGDLDNPYQLVGSTISTSGTCLTLGNDYSADSVSRIATEADPGKQYCYAVYDSLVNN